jgi:hypothetical protein
MGRISNECRLNAGADVNDSPAEEVEEKDNNEDVEKEQSESPTSLDEQTDHGKGNVTRPLSSTG